MTLPDEIYEAIGMMRPNTALTLTVALNNYIKTGKEWKIPTCYGSSVRALWMVICAYVDAMCQTEEPLKTNVENHSCKSPLKINERKEQRKEKETLLPAPLYKEKEKIIEKNRNGGGGRARARDFSDFKKIQTAEAEDVTGTYYEKRQLQKYRGQQVARACETSGETGCCGTDGEVTEILQYFNQRTAGVFLPCEVLSPTNVQQTKNVLRSLGMEKMKKAIDLMMENPFFCGENKRGWKATFPWLLKDDNFYKIINNEYQEDKHIDVDRLRRAREFARISQEFLNQPKPQFDDSVW